MPLWKATIAAEETVHDDGCFCNRHHVSGLSERSHYMKATLTFLNPLALYMMEFLGPFIAPA